MADRQGELGVSLSTPCLYHLPVCSLAEVQARLDGMVSVCSLTSPLGRGLGSRAYLKETKLGEEHVLLELNVYRIISGNSLLEPSVKGAVSGLRHHAVFRCSYFVLAEWNGVLRSLYFFYQHLR